MIDADVRAVGGVVVCAFNPAAFDPAAFDLAVAQALTALERQATGLAAVQARVGRAVTLAPVTAERDWRGVAQQLYDSGLADLRSALASAALAVDDALAETRRAIVSLSSRVG